MKAEGGRAWRRAGVQAARSAAEQVLLSQGSEKAPPHISLLGLHTAAHKQNSSWLPPTCMRSSLAASWLPRLCCWLASSKQRRYASCIRSCVARSC